VCFVYFVVRSDRQYRPALRLATEPQDRERPWSINSCLSPKATRQGTTKHTKHTKNGNAARLCREAVFTVGRNGIPSYEIYNPVNLRVRRPRKLIRRDALLAALCDRDRGAGGRYPTALDQRSDCQRWAQQTTMKLDSHFRSVEGVHNNSVRFVQSVSE
jgi:hypothetical protein